MSRPAISSPAALRVLDDPRVEAPAEAAVAVRGVGKSFALPRQRASTLKESLRHPIASRTYERLHALSDVSFEIQRGEFFSIIGPNGSGKSTLLRCMAGIYEPDTGDIEVQGRLSPFIELGVGFHPDLAALDNVVLAGTLMGLRPAEARDRFGRVITFAELEDFAEMRLRSYSSGMQVRLAFSTSIEVDADVLIFDEVLAVGDALFKEKCSDTLRRLRAQGRTIIFVSHSLDTVREFSDRVLLLERGEIVSLGEPDAVIDEYERRIAERERQLPGVLRESGVEIVDAWLETDDGGRAEVIRQGEQAVFRFLVRFTRDGERPVMGLALHDPDGTVVLSRTDRWRARAGQRVRAGHTQTFTARFPTSLEPGRYRARPLLGSTERDGVVEVAEQEVPVKVEAGEREDPTLAAAERVLQARPAASGLRRLRDITGALAITEFRLRYLDSALGYLWSLVQPLALFAILYLVYSHVVRFGGAVSNYPLKLLLGLVLYGYFSEASGLAMGSLVGRGSIVRKVSVPLAAIPLSSVLTTALTSGISLAFVVLFVAVSGIPPHLAWLGVIPLAGLLFAVTTGISMLLALLFVSFRDLKPVWEVATRVLFFATPIFYPIEVVPESLQKVLMVNPLAVVIVEARHLLIDPSSPGAAAAAGGTVWLAIPLVLTAGVVALAAWVYRRSAPTLAERL